MASGQSDITYREQRSTKGTLRAPSLYHPVQHTGLPHASIITLTLLHVYPSHRNLYLTATFCSFNFEQVNLVRQADVSLADGNLLVFAVKEWLSKKKKPQKNLTAE